MIIQNEMYPDMGKRFLLDKIEECEVEYNDLPCYEDKGFVYNRRRVNPVDAQYLSRNDLGYISIDYMSGITGLSEEELVNELRGTYMFENPRNPGEWITRDQLLQGNLYDTLKFTEKKNRKGRYDENIRVLKKFLPEGPMAEEIEMSLASTWIPTWYKKEFIKYITNMITDPEIDYDPYFKKYRIIKGVILDDFNENYRYGTARISCCMLIQCMMNAVMVVIRDVVNFTSRGKAEYVVNKEETLLAREKQRNIHETFKKWIHDNPEMEERLREIYVEKYSYTVSKFDGTHLRLADLNSEVSLYQHQKNAIERIIASGKNTFIAHDVGAGKTYVFEIGVHELLRLGICRKAIIVVPNPVLDAVVKTYQYLYPEDKFLAVYPNDFTPAKRKNVIDRMKSDKDNLIFMAFSSFDMLTMSREYYLNKLQKEIEKCKAALHSKKGIQGSLKTTLNRLSKEYLKLYDSFKNTITSCFDEMEFDCVVVDEAHNYKNISLEYRLDGIVGMHSKGSKKADEMLEKVHYVEKNGGKIIFASGTPITNSMADLYVIQKYLQFQELEQLDISKFSEWISTFGEQDTSFEVSVDMNYQFATRFSHFHNLPELMALFSNVCDFYHIDENEIDLPDVEESKIVKITKSESQKKYMDDLVRRAEDIHAHTVNRKEDNMLKVTIDGRLASLDMRLVEPDCIIVNDENKTKVCADKLKEIYMGFPDTTQIVFCDISTPKKGFNVYDELKKELIFRGIPEEEIAFIHDASTERKRRSLFQKFNRGIVRVLIGSTQKLGTGCNVQEKLIALHHLDVAWRPSDLQQRRGRMVRQGNTNKRTFEYNYCTEGTLDAFSYQKLESKQKFISSFLSGMLNPSYRSGEDVSDAVLTYSEIKAAAIGNPLIKKRVEVSNRIEHTKIAYHQKEKERKKMQALICDIPIEIEYHDKLAANYERADAQYKKNKESIPNEERIAFGKELLTALSDTNRTEEQLFDWYQGFRIYVPAGMEPDKKYILLRGEKCGVYRIEMNTEKLLGVTRRIDRVLDNFENRMREQRKKAEALRNQLTEVQLELENSNPYYAELEDLKKELTEIDEKLKEREGADGNT